MNHWRQKEKKPENTFKVMKLDPRAKLPTRGTADSAGLDLYAIEEMAIPPEAIVSARTGLAMEIPKGHFGQLCTRSSMGKSGVRIAAGVNIIDADYRGEVLVFLRNDGIYEWHVHQGDRIAQIVICRDEGFSPVLSESLSETARGAGGYGSTGR